VNQNSGADHKSYEKDDTDGPRDKLGIFHFSRIPVFGVLPKASFTKAGLRPRCFCLYHGLNSNQIQPWVYAKISHAAPPLRLGAAHFCVKVAGMIIFWAAVWTLGIYSVQRVLFLFWNWGTYSEFDMSQILQALILGLRFDVTVIAQLSIVVLLLSYIFAIFQKWISTTVSKAILLGTFGFFHLPLMIFNLTDCEFIKFIGRRLSYNDLVFIREVQGKGAEIILTYIPFTLICLSILGLWIFGLVNLYRHQSLPGTTSKSWMKRVVVGFLVFVFFGVSARGGLQNKPLALAHAKNFQAPALNHLLLNTPFVFLQTAHRGGDVHREVFFEDRQQMLSFLNGSIRSESTLPPRNFEKPQNVVLIILESFALEYMGWPNNDKGYTPFLDQLAQKGAFFRNAFANGRRSIEGIGALFGGVPALMSQPFVNSQFLANEFHGLGTVLAEHGYESAFFHGATNGSMYFDSFMSASGVNHYFGKNEYPDKSHDDGTWGIWDEHMFNWFLEKTSQLKPPFFSTIFTLTSHHPFKIPKQYQGRWPQGPLPILESIGYTDWALSEYFKKVEQQPWYADTLFVITADHAFMNFRPEYTNDLGRYRIPIIFFHPKLDLTKVNTDFIVQQLDLGPSLLEFLNLPMPEKQNFMGLSMFRPGDRTAIFGNDEVMHLAKKDYYLEFIRGTGETLYSKKDLEKKNPLYSSVAGVEVSSVGHEEKFKEMTDKLKAYRQYFSEGLLDNRLYYPAVR
jgi:phosphoglycerol transferase MdoB-like AlkP superfamily enzyme